ncbi:MAG: AAA family ATPase [Planctomyces sp.]|nr:AAA family ATPase [Planctomyces sp.]
MDSTKINGQIDFGSIPAALQDRDQWVLWKTFSLDGQATRMPLSVYNEMASSTDPKTWASFENAVTTYDPSEHSGIGFMFTLSDPFCCINLVGCRDPETGTIADWASKEVLRFKSYTEISPSETGLRIFLTAGISLPQGRTSELRVPEIVAETPKIEIFTADRYFPVTGCVYKQYRNIENRESEVLAFLKDHWPLAPQVDATEHAAAKQPVSVRDSSFAGIDASELAAYATQNPDWLVDELFTIDEPLLVGARSKGCKTLQLTDLAVAIASGTPWMGVFNVTKRRKVLLITGEANYRRIAKHIEKACKVRGIKFADLKGFLRVEAIKFPCLPSKKDQAAIRADVTEHGIEVVIVDPLYRGLAGVDAARLSEMGSAIKAFQAACAPACMILSHHVVKSAARQFGEPPTLEDMTGAGIAESCGQWWLVGRNQKYAWDWKHDLCVQFGGREGQGGGRRILFDEHAWTFQVEPWGEYTEQAKEELERQREDARREAEERKQRAARVQILRAVRNIKTSQSKNQICDSCGAVQSDFRVVFPQLVQEMTLVIRPYRDALNRLQATGYILNEYAAEYDRKTADGV